MLLRTKNTQKKPVYVYIILDVCYITCSELVSRGSALGAVNRIPQLSSSPCDNA